MIIITQSGPFIGTHPLWGDMTLTYGDRILRQALVSMTFENQFESDTVVVSKNSTDIADTKEGISTGEGTGIGIGEKERNYREISLGDASVDVELLQEYPLLCSENNTLLSSSTVESTKGTPKLGRLFSRTKSFTTEQDKEKKFNLGFKMGFGSKKGGQSVVEEGLRSATPIATSSSSRNKSRYVVSGGITYPVDTRFPPNVVCPQLNISTSRPLFYPSPSGEYCAVFWPESSFYLLFKVKVVRKSKTHGKKKEGAGGGKNRHQSMLSIDEGELEDEHTHDLKNFNSEKERVDSAESDSFIEVDKGRGISFGWIGMGSTYAVLEPGYRLETIDQKRSGIFSKNEKEIGLFVSPQLVIKVIASSNTIAGTVGSHDEATTSIPSTGLTSFPIIVDMSALDVVNTTSTSSSSASILPQELFGGMLICISTPLRSTVYNKDPKSAHSAQKSISKIEADALAQQQINSKKEQIEKDRAEVGGKMSRSSAASVESIVSASAASWEDSAGGGGEYFRATQKSRFYILSSSSSSASNNISRLDIPQTSTALTTPAASAGSSPDPGLDCVKTFALKPVGPSLSGVRCVTWDLTSGLCVVLIGSTVNILKLEVEKQGEVVKRDEAVELGQGHRDNTKRAGELGSSSTVALSMFASIDLLAYTCSYSSITSSSLILPSATFMWKNGQLFVLTSTELLLLFSDYPFIEQHTNEKSTVSREKDQRVDAIYPRLNVLIVASTSADASASSMDGTLRSMNAYIDRDKGKEKVQSRDTTGKDPERNWERDRNQESIGTFNTVQPLKSSHGHLDILGCRRGHILLSSRYDRKITDKNR